MMQQIVEGLPSVGTIPGFVFYSVMAYFVSLFLSICMSRFVANNLNLEESVKKEIVKRRDEESEKKELIKELMELCRQ